MQPRNGLTAAVVAVAALGILGIADIASAQMRITEYQYQGADPNSSEFVEFTNIGASPINMNNWKYSDQEGLPEAVSLSAYGTVAPGESVILCEGTAATFRAAWGLAPTVKVIGSNINNLGREDTINLDSANALIDTIQYSDIAFPGSIRALGRSGWPCAQAIGNNQILNWRLSNTGDAQNSFASSFFDIANPGTFVSFTCPAAPTGACCAAGSCLPLTQQECTGVGLYQGNGTTCGGVTCPAPSNAQVRITEFMHDGVAGGEFIEFRNMGGTSVNMTGWSYSDEARVPGLVSLSAFGTIAAGEVVILTPIDAADFRTDWGLPGTVKVIGGNTTNIGAQDEVNIYDNSGALVDRLTYGHLTCALSPDTWSAHPCSTAVGTNDILEWRRSAVSDPQGSVTNLVGDIGKPGSYTSVVCTSGSCCLNNTCSIMSQGDCLSAQGLYFGDGTNCTSHPCPAPNNSEIRITEFMYQGTNGEFFEITNLGTTPVNLNGWSFADSCQRPGVFSLSGVGTLDPGESAVVTDNSPATFNAAWSLSGVTVASLPSSELGNEDQIRIHDPNGAIVDILHYGSPGSPVTINSSAWPIQSGVGEDRIGHWTLSTVGDQQNSFASSGGDVGNPGQFQLFDIPAASTWGLVMLAILLPTAGTLIARRKATA